MADIELKSVRELLGMKFFIPSYQRGYRWTKQQVKDLLNDVAEFKEKWYCLQPLVVRQMDDDRKKECLLNEKETWYEVIDGQQRLTTIYIIINLLDSNSSLSLQYETRKDSASFLQNIKTEQDDSNIDFYFMLEAKQTINEWQGDKEKLLQKLVNSCKVIWYETEDDAYEVFKRLNSGKLSLSNAELVKALLLKDDNFTGIDEAVQLKQLEMAGEWDRIEQSLHDDSFWYFINPEPEDAKYNCTRMDFILEIILRCKHKEKSEEFLYNVDDELSKNDYFIFSVFSEMINKNSWREQWKEIQNCFRTIKSWYDDRKKYHYIGYLMNLKGKDKKDTLRDLICESVMPKDEFLRNVISKCRKTIIKDNQKEIDFSQFEYGKNNDEIHNILLLFNLATVQNQISETSRYPFDKHFKAAKKKWSLEHIHAQNERKATWDKEQFDKIKGYLNNIKNDGTTELTKYLKDIETSDGIDDETYKAIISAFMGRNVVKKEANGKVFFSSDFEKDDHLTNMALLQGDKNAAFNNKTYPEKREKLAEYENVESESLFVPICTRNVFFKHYSPNSINPLVWDEHAGLEYVSAIVKVIASYLKMEAVLPSLENDNKYGLKKKEEKK
ncbi:MAG: DUF262 domain-containing protein [Bacteroidales bacterium]|nr:DUF262 domain-containing protein [Bacteroidales bacterium]